MSSYTNVITNFKRPQHLAAAIKSLRGAPTVAATFGATPEHEAIYRQFPAVRHTSTPQDYGCNRLWIQAIAQARTKWVAILHDDDRRPEGFDQKVRGLIDQCEKHGAGFAVWHGLQYWEKENRTGSRIVCGSKITGLRQSADLIPQVLKRGALPWSPVSLLLRRDDCLDILTWCEKWLKEECHTRPEMMIGNDAALLLGHIRRYPYYIQSTDSLSLYGHWDGSETCAFAAGQNPELINAYDKAKDILDNKIIGSRSIGSTYESHDGEVDLPLFVHVTSSGPNADNPRQILAQQTWKTAWSKIEDDNIVVPLKLRPADLVRTTQNTIGDQRPLAFIRDLIIEARKLCKPTDIICFSNDDVCVTPESFEVLIRHTRLHGAALTHRREFKQEFTVPKSNEEVRTGRWHAGTDLIVFTAKWWDEVMEPNFPDAAIGCEGWDWVVANLIRMNTGSVGYKNLVYHHYHGGWWENPAVRLKNVSNVHNRKICRWWMQSHGIYKGEFEPDSIRGTEEMNKEPQGFE